MIIVRKHLRKSKNKTSVVRKHSRGFKAPRKLVAKKVTSKPTGLNAVEGAPQVAPPLAVAPKPKVKQAIPNSKVESEADWQKRMATNKPEVRPKNAAPSPKMSTPDTGNFSMKQGNPNIPKKKRSDYEGTSFMPYTNDKQQGSAQPTMEKGKKVKEPKPTRNVQRQVMQAPAPKRSKIRRGTDLFGKLYTAQLISGGARSFANTARKMGGL
jgi:hypothetical protein